MKVRQIFEADIRGYFNHINHSWLRRMVAHRIADPVVLSLIGKWLNAGVMQDGVVTRSDEGTPQGGPISPLLANIYLHFVLDLWFEKRFKPMCQGEAYLVRFADDFVVSFQYKRDAERFQRQLGARFARFNLTLAEEKTRLCSSAVLPPTGVRSTVRSRTRSSSSASNTFVERIGAANSL